MGLFENLAYNVKNLFKEPMGKFEWLQAADIALSRRFHNGGGSSDATGLAHVEDVLGHMVDNDKTSRYLGTYEKVGMVFAFTNAISDAYANIPVEIHRWTDRAKGESEQIQDERFDVIMNPNRYTDGFLYRKTVASNIILAGNHYADIFAPAGRIIELHQMPPAQFTPFGNKDSNREIGGFLQVKKDGKKKKWKPEEIDFVRNYNPQNPIMGQSWIQAAAPTLDIDIATSKRQKENVMKGYLKGIVTSDQKGSEGKNERIKQMIQQMFDDMEETGGTGYLSDGYKWQSMGLPGMDLNYLEQKRLTADDLMFIFRTPVLVLGKHEGANRAGSGQIIGQWYNTTIRGIVNIIQGQQNHPWAGIVSRITGGDRNIFLKHALEKEPVYAAILTAARLENAERAFKMGGISPNEVAAIQGVPPSENDAADARYLALNLVKIEDKDNKATSQTDGNTGHEDDDDEDTKSHFDKALKALAELEKPIQTKSLPTPSLKVEEISDEAKKNVWESFDRRIRASMSPFQTKVQKILEDVYAEAAKNMADRDIKSIFEFLTKEQGAKAVVDFDGIFDEDIFDKEAFATTLTTSSKPFIVDSFDEGTNQIAELLNNIINPESVVADQYTANRLQFFGTKVTQTVESRIIEEVNAEIAEAIISGNAERLSVSEVAKNIEALGKSIAPKDAQRIARTELVNANNAGAVEYMEAAGVSKKTWLTQRDGKVRAGHAKMEGVTVDMGANFITPDGPMQFPSAINERCTILPS